MHPLLGMQSSCIRKQRKNGLQVEDLASQPIRSPRQQASDSPAGGAAAAKRFRGSAEDLPPGGLGSLSNAACSGRVQPASLLRFDWATAALQVLASPDIFPEILDCLDWPSTGQAACVCRQWRLLAGSAEASLSADKCWLMWQQPWPPEGPVLRHVQRCKLALCTDRLHLVDFSWPQLPALTAVHIEARLTNTLGVDDTIYWNNKTVRDLSVTVLRTKEHCLAHGNRWNNLRLALGVTSSCLKTLCVRAVVAETGLLIFNPGLGVFVDLQLTSVPELCQLLVCGQRVGVSLARKPPLKLVAAPQ